MTVHTFKIASGYGALIQSPLGDFLSVEQSSPEHAVANVLAQHAIEEQASSQRSDAFMAECDRILRLMRESDGSMRMGLSAKLSADGT